MNKISGLIYSLRIHFEDEEMPEGFYESLDMIDIENRNQQAEIKKLRDALEEIRDYGHIESHEDAYNMIDTANEALKDGK